MDAILLCAGFGTRLEPLTHRPPKALLEVAGRPILDYLMDQLVRVPQVQAVHLVSNASSLGDFYRWAEASWMEPLAARDVSFTLTSNGVLEPDARLGALGDLQRALRGVDASEGVLVAAGDSIYRFDLGPFMEDFDPEGPSRVLALYEENRQRLKEQSVLRLAGDGRVEGVAHPPAAPPTSWTCPAFYLFTPDALAHLAPYVRQTDDVDALGLFVDHLAQEGAVEAVRMPERSDLRFHINTRYQLGKANDVLAEEALMVEAAGAVSTTAGGAPAEGDGPLGTPVVVGVVERAEAFAEARKPKLCKLWIDLGGRTVQSAAQLLYHYTPEALVGRQVLCATGLGSVRVAGFASEVLVVGVPGEDGKPVLVVPDEPVPPGGRLY